MQTKLKSNGSMMTSRNNTKKDVVFIIGDWNAKVGSQEIPGVTGKLGLRLQNESGPRITEFCQENALVIATLFQQHRRRLYIWTSPDGQYWNQIDYVPCSWRWRIPVELFRILKDDAVKVLHPICQQIWKTQQWPQDWKRSVFIPILKKGNAKEYSNYHTTALISHACKVMLKILQARLQQ